MDDDLKLRVRLDSISTYQTAVSDEGEFHLKLDGVLAGAADNLLPLLRARQKGRPVVEITIVAIEPEPEPDGRVPFG